MRASVVAVSLAVAALATPCSARQQRPSRPVGPGMVSPAPRTLDRHLEMNVLARRYDWEAFLAGYPDDLPPQTLERIDRANRISGMMERGQCAEARALANAEGDRVMALRVRQLCRTPRD